MCAQARALANLLGAGAGVAAAALPAPWVLSDPAHAGFGDEVPAAAANDDRHFKSQGNVALVMIDDVWTVAERVPTGQLEAWKLKKASGPGRDPRLLPDTRNALGHRDLPLEAALNHLRPQSAPGGWPFGGPGVAAEFLAGLRRAGFAPTLYTESWERTSGVRASSAAAREHRALLEAVRLGLSFDQLDLPATALSEYLVKRIVQVEKAVKRAPLAPDYGGLEHMLSTSVDATGAVIPQEFDRWSANVMRDEAQVLKQNRLWREGQTHLARKGKGKGTDKGGGGGAAPAPTQLEPR